MSGSGTSYNPSWGLNQIDQTVSEPSIRQYMNMESVLQQHYGLETAQTTKHEQSVREFVLLTILKFRHGKL
jgi:hypothetical protein